MTEWKRCKISDIGTVIGGATPSTKKVENYEGGEIPWITPRDLSSFTGRYICRGERNITETGLKSCSTQLLPKNSVLFSSRAPIGYIAIAKNEVCTNQGFKSVIPDINTHPLFLYYLLKYNKEKIENISSGTTFKEVSGNTMKNVEITIPMEFEIQEKIASILGTLDDKIEENERINNNLEEQAFAIFNDLFPRTYNGLRRIGEFVSPQRGKNLLTKDAALGDVPVVAGGLNPSTFHNVANTKAPVVTISASGANAGFVRLWNKPVWSSDSSFIDRSVSDHVYFWYALLKTRQKEIYDAQTGSAQPHIYPKHIADLAITDVETNKMERYCMLVEPVFQLIGNLQQEAIKLEALRNTLLPKLMSGKLDISELDL